MKYKTELIDLLRNLIGFQTTASNSGQIVQCIEYIEQYFSNSPLIIRKYVSNNIPSLIVSNKNTKSFDLLFNGHVDVVSADKSLFTAKILGDKVIGRGAIDMKGSIAVLMVLMKNLPKTDNSIGLMIVSDEETDGSNGTKFLLNTIGYISKMTVIAEESNFDVVTRQKGQITIKIQSIGKSGHGAQPWTGINAIEKLIDFYGQLKRQIKDVNLNAWDACTINLGKISGGTAHNVIPDRADMCLDIRYPTKKALDKIIIALEILSKSSCVSYKILSQTNPMESGNVKSFIKQLTDITEAVITRKIQEKWTNYCSDGRYFTDNNMRVFEFGPTGANYHSENEYVSIRSLIQYLNILRTIIRKWVK